jgi:hypothetical protein
MTATQTKPEHPAQHERDAARRYLEHDHASEHLSGEPAAEANRNAQAIDEEHPRVRDIALTGTARELGKLPAHLRRHQLAARQRAGISSEDAARIRGEYRSPPAESEPESEPRARPPARERARAAAGTAAGRAGQAARSTGGLVDAVDTGGWSDLVGQFFLMGAVLSIFYLFLTRASAASKLWLGATNVVRAVVSPVVDPLNPKGAL